MSASSVVYPFPAGLPLSECFEVTVDGDDAFVHDTLVGSFCSFEASEGARVFVRPRRRSGAMTVRPTRLALTGEPCDGGFMIELDRPQQLYVEFGPGVLPLFLFANPAEREKPRADDPKVRYFRGGNVHDAGRIELTDGESLYLEGGAVVRGHVYGRGSDIRVHGPGLLYGSHFPESSVRLMVFDGCTDLRVEDIVTVGTPSWNLVLGACERASVERLKLIGWVVSSDGIDIVGSRDVTVRDCFLRNNDDCVVVKAVDYRDRGEGIQENWARNVSNVLVERCTLYNDRAGNAMEIGFELQTESVSDITFRDIDVIAGHGEGGIFTIHNGDRATVSNVLYEAIRVEHFYDKLIDFRIMHSRYSVDLERGRIRNVVLRNISTIEDRYNTISLIGGFDADHDIQGVEIESLKMGSKLIHTTDELNLYSKHASDIRIH